jgi:hypothetical protein
MKVGKVVVVSSVVGGVLGLLIVRGFFLDPFQEMGWSMFWHGLTNGEPMDISTVLQSTTLYKCLGGFILGGLAGGFVGIKLKNQMIIKESSPNATVSENSCVECGATVNKEDKICHRCGGNL